MKKSMAAVAEALLLLARTFENQGAVLEVTLKRILLDFSLPRIQRRFPQMRLLKRR